MMNDSKHTVSLLVHDVAHQLRIIIDGKVEPFNLTRQKWVALTILEDHPGISQADLAERLEIDRSSAGRLLDRMEKSGLVYRRKDETDRRIIRVYVKEEARPVLDQLHDVSSEIQTVTQSGLSDEEQEDLVRLLRKVQTNLKVGFTSLICFFDWPDQAFFMANFL
ncbi:MAG: MarR family transcriptional regulator [Methylocystaceae bacterium]|nr:MarR family transcriptional regulator [Methylocystaceae bacterium]